MTTPARTRDPEQKIRDIGEAAARLVAESGPAALTHRAVAARAGVAVGTITRYFATIDDLRTRALEHLADEVDRDLATLTGELGRAADPVAYLVDTAAESLSDIPGVLAECALTFAGLFEEDLRDLSLRWVRGFADALTPHFGTERAEILAICMDGAYLNTALTGTPPDAARLRRVITAIIAIPHEDGPA